MRYILLYIIIAICCLLYFWIFKKQSYFYKQGYDWAMFEHLAGTDLQEIEQYVSNPFNQNDFNNGAMAYIGEKQNVV